MSNCLWIRPVSECDLLSPRQRFVTTKGCAPSIQTLAGAIKRPHRLSSRTQNQVRFRAANLVALLVFVLMTHSLVKSGLPAAGNGQGKGFDPNKAAAAYSAGLKQGGRPRCDWFFTQFLRCFWLVLSELLVGAVRRLRRVGPVGSGCRRAGAAFPPEFSTENVRRRRSRFLGPHTNLLFHTKLECEQPGKSVREPIIPAPAAVAFG